MTATTDRAALLAQLAEPRIWDVAIVGGGATGLGAALDAAARGLKVVLLESHDFAKGTSSRATKLLHGGVRYLAQGNLSLVREALHERATILSNAPHLSQPLAFVMPAYRWWESPFYGLGLKAYDMLAGDAGLGPTEWLGSAAVRDALPNVRTEGLRGGVRYWDAQFDDARLAIALARTAAAHGALLINHCAVTGLLHDAGRVSGLECQDRAGAAGDAGAAHSGTTFRVQARCVINATGVWVDGLRQRDAQARPPQPLVSPSQGVHLVVDRDFLPGDNALLVPRTRDGRVLFAVPWLGKVILGTTDTPRPDAVHEPEPLQHEVQFILGEAANVLARAPTVADVRSCWVGLRPLVRPQGAGGSGGSTSAISREHTVEFSASGLVTVTGGKWTTYRSMAHDVLQRCAERGLLSITPADVTRDLPLTGAGGPQGCAGGLSAYGSEQPLLQALPGAQRMLAPGVSEAMVRFAARHEYARTVEDMLARRHRLLFLDAGAAAAAAPAVAQILADETGADPQCDAFIRLAQAWAGAAQAALPGF